MFTDRTYLRGASALYALREEVGDRTFFRILRTFVTAYRGRNATSRDFIELAVVVSGRPSVAPLLHAWLYDEPVPALAGHAAATALTRGGRGASRPTSWGSAAGGERIAEGRRPANSTHRIGRRG